MKDSLCVLLLFLTSLRFSVPLITEVRDGKFNEWLEEYREEVGEHFDLGEVYSNWLENAKFVEEHNSLESSYKVHLNKFSHMKLNQRSGLIKLDSKHELKAESPGKIDARDIPTSVDWRKKGVLFPPKSQGQSGYPAPIDVVHAIDSYWAIKHGILVAASIQEYSDCCGHFVNYTCVVDIGGLASDAAYRSNGSCQSEKYKPIVFIQGGKSIPPGDELALAEAVAKQPVVVAIDASHMSFQLYRSGVYSALLCSTTKLDHIMLLVGYGTTEDGEEYWICQNSWGQSWGMEGYILLKRNANNMCGIATAASYPV